MNAVDRARPFEEPGEFSELMLRRNLWSRQREIAESIIANQHTSVKGSHASGKTFLASGLPLWWLLRFKRGKVFQTSPTLRQVKTFWREVSLARDSSRIALPPCSSTGLELSKDRYAIGASASVGVNLQGLHGSEVLIIVDEAPGIAAEIWDAIEGVRAGGFVRMLTLGNPTVPSGTFYDFHTRSRGTVKSVSISAFDTPNLEGITIERLLEMTDDELDANPIPYLVTRRWVRDRYLNWGPTHPKYYSRVLAQFPTQSEWSVFSLEWIEKAKRDPTEAELSRQSRFPIQVGIDVAGPGDDETTLCARQGGAIIETGAWAEPDPRGKVLQKLGLLQVRSKRDDVPMLVVVDTVGIGYNFALHIADQGFDVRGFVAGGRPLDPEQYEDAKAEAYFTTREYFKQGMISGLDDEETEAQLSGLLYRETSIGRIRIESKDDARKRGMRSPDRAEGVVMAFCPVVPREQQVAFAQPIVISTH